MPKVNFKKINKLRVYANQQGTGKELREDLMTMGGAAKFYRTKRMNNLINKPMSMWEATHLTTSSKVQAIQDPGQTAESIVKDLDTSFCHNYDMPGVDSIKLKGIS